MGISRELAAFVCSHNYEDLPQDVIATQKQALLDGIAITLGAGTLGDSCRDFVNFAEEMAETSGSSTVIGFHKKLPMLWAAFANASMAHALDFSDTYSIGSIHSNSSTMPAALALAESMGEVDGKTLITALALGSEVACRLSKAVKPKDFIKYGFYMPPVFTAFGAAAACGKLLNLNEEQMLNAFSFTLSTYTCSSELTNNSDTVIRSVREAFGAKAALTAALLAKRGHKGFAEPFEGKLGFYTMYFRGEYDAAAITEGLGHEFECSKLVFKPWPCCMGNHGAINAALNLMKAHPIRPDDIVSIEAEVPTVATVVLEPVEQKRHPQNSINAKFSLPFTVSTAILDGNVTLSSFSEEAIHREDILSLAQKVSYKVNAAWDTDPSANLGSALIIRTKDGEYRDWVKKTLGNKETPMSESDFLDKLRGCAAYAAVPVSEEDLAQIIRLIQNIEEVRDIKEITALL